MDVIGRFYKLAERLDDDLHVVAFCIKQYRPYAPSVEEIAKKLGDAEPDEFATVIDRLLDLPDEELRKVAKNPTFRDEKSYALYLQGLLDHLGAFYVPFIRGGGETHA